jgi:hypothetical protein
MRQVIPTPLLSVVADIASDLETHATLESLFMYSGALGDPPVGSKQAKALEWLRRINKDDSVDPMKIVGALVGNYMEAVPKSWNEASLEAAQTRLNTVLLQCKLRYVTGGTLTGALAAPSQSLEKVLQTFDFDSVNGEFARALENVTADPREAVSAASNILESFCKVYIAENNLDQPQKQDLKSVWTTVRKHLGFDPAVIEDRDLQTILGGLLATVEGIGALRTHASSAHGAGRNWYKLEPRHARLAIHAAHTVTLFALETWQKRKTPSMGKQ